MAFLSREPLDLATLIARVTRDQYGAVATFIGAVRNHHGGRPVAGLDYSAYEAMVEAECGRIVEEAEERWTVSVALAHRIGRLAVGDLAVAVAVGSAHRAAAFDACRFVMEEVKRRLPIWKRERYADGSEDWVGDLSAQTVEDAS